MIRNAPCTKCEYTISQSAWQIRNASLTSRVLRSAKELIQGLRGHSLHSENSLCSRYNFGCETVPETKSQRNNTRQQHDALINGTRIKPKLCESWEYFVAEKMVRRIKICACISANRWVAKRYRVANSARCFRNFYQHELWIGQRIRS